MSLGHVGETIQIELSSVGSVKSNSKDGQHSATTRKLCCFCLP